MPEIGIIIPVTDGTPSFTFGGDTTRSRLPSFISISTIPPTQSASRTSQPNPPGLGLRPSPTREISRRLPMNQRVGRVGEPVPSEGQGWATVASAAELKGFEVASLDCRYPPTRDLPTQDSASSRASDDNKETLSSASIVAPLWALTQTSCRSDCITSSSSCLPARAARLDCPRVLEETVRVRHRQVVSVCDLRT